MTATSDTTSAIAPREVLWALAIPDYARPADHAEIYRRMIGKVVRLTAQGDRLGVIYRVDLADPSSPFRVVYDQRAADGYATDRAFATWVSIGAVAPALEGADLATFTPDVVEMLRVLAKYEEPNASQDQPHSAWLFASTIGETDVARLRTTAATIEAVISGTSAPSITRAKIDIIRTRDDARLDHAVVGTPWELRDSGDSSPTCRATTTGTSYKYCCTRLQGHTGQHVAGGVNDVRHVWPNEDQPQPQVGDRVRITIYHHDGSPHVRYDGMTGTLAKIDTTTDTTLPYWVELDVESIARLGWDAATRPGLWAHKVEVLSAATDESPATDDRSADAASPARVAELEAEVARLQTLTTHQARKLDSLERWRDDLVRDAHQYANDNDLCERFDDFMDEHDLPRRSRSYRVRTSVTVDVYVVIESATDEDDAMQQVDDMDSAVIEDVLYGMSRHDLDVTTWSADSARPD